ncbi:hypothetical protein K7432_017918 [Basidiobolus ranarum]|uniref:Uncharacterized protein n=1 Tax=Basidiobolus ranarum TaxID=34480 RepID=A0ABR2WCS5_9FUNG
MNTVAVNSLLHQDSHTLRYAFLEGFLTTISGSIEMVEPKDADNEEEKEQPNPKRQKTDNDDKVKNKSKAKMMVTIKKKAVKARERERMLMEMKKMVRKVKNKLGIMTMRKRGMLVVRMKRRWMMKMMESFKERSKRHFSMIHVNHH